MSYSTPLNQVIHTYGVVDEGVLTCEGSVLGGLSLSGIEPMGLSEEERTHITQMIRCMIQQLPAGISLSQYYWHQQGVKVNLKPRPQPRAQLVSSRRAAFLNHRELAASSLFWVLDVPTIHAHRSGLGTLCHHLFHAIFDLEARKNLKTALHHQGIVLVEYEALQTQLNTLRKTLDSMNARLTFWSPDNRLLGPSGLWGLQKALVNLNPAYLGEDTTPPVERWDIPLMTGEIEAVMIGGRHTLKISGTTPMYARIASVTSVGRESMPPSAWGQMNPAKRSPVLQPGNYLFFTRFKPYTREQHQKMVSEKHNELIRAETKVTDFLTGASVNTAMKKRIAENPHLKRQFDELMAAQHSDDGYGVLTSMVVVFDTDPQRLNITEEKVHNALNIADFSFIQEGPGLLRAYESLLLGYPGKTLRDTKVTTTQAGAMALPFRSHEGQKSWELNLKPEEAIYLFESVDGVPFHYSSFVGEMNFVIGIGPTGSGKTFTKTCIATHTLKLGGLYCALDIDQGSEPLAAFFGKDGAVFRLTKNDPRGFNPFHLCEGGDDVAFHEHLFSLLRSMLKTNDEGPMQHWTPEEQKEVDAALKQMMRLAQSSPELATFSGLLGHCSQSVNDKLAAFKRGGRLGHLFDNDIDAIRVLDAPVSVYNLEGVKDSPEQSSLVYKEIFFRMIRTFENEKYLTLPKFLEVDEAQYVLGQPGTAEFLLSKARTWRKHGGGMGFWSQSPKHFSQLKEWDVLKSAASTFLFMADPKGKSKDYLEAFDFLTQAQAQIIINMTPKEELFIVQPDLGIAKVVQLHVEPEQYVIATSKAAERAVANRIYQEEENIDIAIDKIIKTLGREDAPC